MAAAASKRTCRSRVAASLTATSQKPRFSFFVSPESCTRLIRSLPNSGSSASTQRAVASKLRCPRISRRQSITISVTVSPSQVTNIAASNPCGNRTRASRTMHTKSAPKETHIASTAVLKSVNNHHFCRAASSR